MRIMEAPLFLPSLLFTYWRHPWQSSAVVPASLPSWLVVSVASTSDQVVGFDCVRWPGTVTTSASR